MTKLRDVVIVSGVRTAIGSFGGSLKDVSPAKMGGAVVAEAVKRAGLESKEIGGCVVGNVIPTEPADMYLARVVGMLGGLPTEAHALSVNRLCGSGLQAVVTAARSVMMGDSDTVVAAGVESMSRAPYLLPALRWGQRMGDAKALDMMIGSLTDPFGNGHMGITAENLAVKYNISREEQDAYSVESQSRASKARAAGHFKDQIMPFEIETRKGPVTFAVDEFIRDDATKEALAKLKPAFKKDGTVTPGNSSGINDGAAALVLMEAEAAQKRGIKPLARFVASSYSAVEPSEMGIGPVPAVEAIMKKSGLKLKDMDVIEANEAFAAQAMAVAKVLDLDPAKTNPNGGAIACGHPIGASGAIITIKAIHELKRVNGRYALITLCIGGGQGIAAIIENMQ